jgi:hypothetical protein
VFSSERKIIGVTVSDVEQALTEQYGRTSLRERGRSQDTVSYLVRLSARAPGLATILPNPAGVTLRLSPYIGTVAGCVYAVLIVIGLFFLLLPGLFIAFFLGFRLWLAGRIMARQIDNIAKGAEHQSKLAAMGSSSLSSAN